MRFAETGEDGKKQGRKGESKTERLEFFCSY